LRQAGYNRSSSLAALCSLFLVEGRLENFLLPLEDAERGQVVGVEIAHLHTHSNPFICAGFGSLTPRLSHIIHQSTSRFHLHNFIKSPAAMGQGGGGGSWM
jgi:hypothetical protein